MILVDSTIPMYLVGAPHPHKADAQRVLEKLIADRERLVTDAEVLQEILHRYVAIDRRDAIQPAFDALLGVVDEVLTVDRGGQWNVQNRLFSDIGNCLLATLYISRLWNKMEFARS